MSFGFYFNMEKFCLEIALKHLDNMTNDNMFDDIFLDNDKIINNMQNGVVIISQLCVFFESFLNTILVEYMETYGEKFLKCNIDEKLNIIFMYYRKKVECFKSKHCWEIYKRMVKMRNEMVHYKKVVLSDAGFFPDFCIAGNSINDFFRKDNMINIIEGCIELVNIIAQEVNLIVNHNVAAFACDGMSDIVKYVDIN